MVALYAEPRIDDVLRSPKLFIETFLWIKAKSGQLVPFLFNEEQNLYYQILIDNYWQEYRDKRGHRRGRFMGIREVNCKSRQFGLSTQIEGLLYHDTVTHEGTDTRIYCQDKKFSKDMLEKCRIFYDYTPEEWRPAIDKDNVVEMSFPGLLSTLSAHTPGTGEEVAGKQGRSVTIRNLHGSEFSSWPNPKRTMRGLRPAIPDDGNIFLEFSPKKMGDYSHVMYNKGKEPGSIWSSRFWPWFQIKKYREHLSEAEKQAVEKSLTPKEKKLVKRYKLDMEQIAWRRKEINEAAGDEFEFIKEYPEDDESCFESGAELVFPADLRKITCLARPAIPGHVHVIGVDVSLGIPDRDRSAIVVIDAVTGEQIFEWCGWIDPEELAQKVYEVWLEYPGLVGIESNGIGLATLRAAYKIKDPGFEEHPSLHFRRFLFANNRTYGGWYTGETNKGPTIFALKTAIRQAKRGNPGVKLSSKQIVKEMGWFQHLPGGGMGAKSKKEEGEGLTDDTVMALAIAFGMLEYINGIERPFNERFGTQGLILIPDTDLWIPTNAIGRVSSESDID